ncbi:uncharacterized protein LOC115763220 [Drosophila novamexicana]|uniref:uncharacterized protein LOC115763220 n=1 Tax=Drosophila novamexicana TaxID=47314 RepID=UPI0011E59169|nr:uncharacterized protein LOC115763220 [Drosophila novamexicana]
MHPSYQSAQQPDQMQQLRELQRQQQQQEQRRMQQYVQQQQQQQQQEPQIVFSRGGRALGEQDQNRIVVVIPEELFVAFVRKVYLIATVFILITCAVWLTISILEVDFIEATKVPSFVWFILTFVTFIIFHWCPRVRYIFPVNWILVVCIVAFLTLGGCCYMSLYDPLILLCGMVIALAVIVILHVCGAMCPLTVLPGGLLTGCLMIIIMIVLLVFAFLMFFLRDPVYGIYTVAYRLCHCLICRLAPSALSLILWRSSSAYHIFTTITYI